MSSSALPAAKRGLSGSSAVRNQKKAFPPSLFENVPVDGVALHVNDSSFPSAASVKVVDAVANSDSPSPPVSPGSSAVAKGPVSKSLGDNGSANSNGNKFMATASPAIPSAAAVKVVDPVANSDSSSPPLSPGSSAVAKGPVSPGSNRQRFMDHCQPLKVSCDLATVGMHNPSVRFSFTAIVMVVFPETQGPERRHLQLIDERGSTGLTVWNENVRLFSQSSVGQVVKFTKLCMVFNNGKKQLSMSRDSSVTFVNTLAVPCEESRWWKSLLLCKPLRIIDVHDCEENSLVNVAGIVGMLHTERKRVKDADRDLLCIRLTDRTGFVDVRSWTHSEQEFASFLEQPMLLQRVRVCVFASIKTLELLSGMGTKVIDDFDGKADLMQYWSE